MPLYSVASLLIFLHECSSGPFFGRNNFCKEWINSSSLPLCSSVEFINNQDSRSLPVVQIVVTSILVASQQLNYSYLIFFQFVFRISSIAFELTLNHSISCFILPLLKFHLHLTNQMSRRRWIIHFNWTLFAAGGFLQDGLSFPIQEAAIPSLHGFHFGWSLAAGCQDWRNRSLIVRLSSFQSLVIPHPIEIIRFFPPASCCFPLFFHSNDENTDLNSDLPSEKPKWIVSFQNRFLADLSVFWLPFDRSTVTAVYNFEN